MANEFNRANTNTFVDRNAVENPIEEDVKDDDSFFYKEQDPMIKPEPFER